MFDDEELHLLAALERAGNLRRAATALGQPPATVSRRLIALERRLGHELYLRKGRQLLPTRAGALILTRAAAALRAREELAAATRALTHGGKTTLTVAASPLFAELVLAEAIAKLRSTHAELRVDVRLGHDVTALHEGKIDVAFRRGPLHEVSSLRAKKLGRTTMVCVAARQPTFDAGAGPEARIRAFPWVRVATRPEPFELRWRVGRGRSVALAVSPHVTVDSQRVALALVERGPFAARLNLFLVREALAARALVEIAPEARSTEDVFAVYPEQRSRDSVARELVACVASVAAAAGLWDEG